jgi:hypothetical protein
MFKLGAALGILPWHSAVVKYSIALRLSAIDTSDF